MEGVLARELVAELEDLTRAVRGLVRLVAYVLEVEVPIGETPGATGDPGTAAHHRPGVDP